MSALEQAAERSAKSLDVIDNVRSMLAHCATVEAYQGADERFYRKLRMHFLGVQLALVRFEHPDFDDNEALAYIRGTEFARSLTEHSLGDDTQDVMALRAVAVAAFEWVRTESRGIQDMGPAEQKAVEKLIGALTKAGYEP